MRHDGLVDKYEAADLVGVSWRTIERWVFEKRLERWGTDPKHGAALYLISAVRYAERTARRGAAPNPGPVRRRPRNLASEC